MTTINGTIKVFQDSSGFDYLAFDVQYDQIEHYVQFLSNHIESSFFENQKKRDKDQYHITILDVIKYGSLKKYNPEIFESVIQAFISVNQPFKAYGIGSVSSLNLKSITDIPSHAYFAIVKNEKISDLRNKYFSNLNFQHLHCTLAFQPKDVHGKEIDKGMNSLIFTDEEIHKNNKKISLQFKK